MFSLKLMVARVQFRLEELEIHTGVMQAISEGEPGQAPTIAISVLIRQPRTPMMQKT